MGVVHSHEGESDYQFDLSGGAPCLDFANTVSQRKNFDRSVDRLGSYDDLLAFEEQSKILSHRQADELRAQSRRHRGAAQDAFRRAIAYRENLYRAFSALAEGKAAAPDDVQQINDFAVDALRAFSHRVYS